MEDQYEWDGQGLKDPYFFKTFFRITKSQRKANVMREKLGSLKTCLPRRGLGIF
jgi:hypothetical protein